MWVGVPTLQIWTVVVVHYCQVHLWLLNWCCLCCCYCCLIFRCVIINLDLTFHTLEHTNFTSFTVIPLSLLNVKKEILPRSLTVIADSSNRNYWILKLRRKISETTKNDYRDAVLKRSL